MEGIIKKQCAKNLHIEKKNYIIYWNWILTIFEQIECELTKRLLYSIITQEYISKNMYYYSVSFK